MLADIKGYIWIFRGGVQTAFHAALSSGVCE